MAFRRKKYIYTLAYSARNRRFVITDNIYCRNHGFFYAVFALSTTKHDSFRPAKSGITSLVEQKRSNQFTQRKYKKMKSLKLKLLAARIELHWWFIRRQRKKGNKLLEAGFSHSSERFLALNRSFSKHCAQAMKAQWEYERASGIHLYAEQI